MNDLKQQQEKRGVAKRVAKNSFFIFTSKVFEIFANLFTTALIARYLGVGSFGVFAVATAVSTALVPLADFGVERIICREVARNTGDATRYVAITMALRLVFSAMILATAGVILYGFSTGEAAFKAAVMVSIAGDLVYSLGTTYLAVVRSFERMGFELIINILYKLSFLLIIIAVWSFDWGLTGIFAGRLLSALLFAGLAGFVLYGKFVKPALLFDRRIAGFIIKESFPLAVSSLCITLIFRVDIFVLTWLGSASDIALFDVPNRMIMQAQMLPVSFSLALFPLLSRFAEKDGAAEGERYYNNAQKILLVLAMPIAALLISSGRPLIVALFGSEFSAAATSLGILAPTIVFLFLISFQNLFITAMNRQVLNTLSVAVALALNFILDILLVPVYGYIGASIATVLSYFVLLAMNTYFIRRLGIQTRQGALIGKTLVATCSMFPVMLIDTGNAVTTLFVRSLGAVALYLTAMVLLKPFSSEDLEGAKAVLRRKKGPEPLPGRP
jgi:O-antigen/teichoic acid export membrane protein